MESIATDVAKSTLEKLVDATIVQSRYICCFTCIADDFEKGKEALEPQRETVKGYVQVANGRDENIRSDVTFWQEQADKLIEEDTKTKVTCFFGWCPNCKWRYSRGKELAHNTEEIKRLIKEVAESNFRSAGIPRSVAGVEYHSSEGYISFKSRKLKYEELLNALTDDNNCIIGLQGMGGAGKTTLAIEVGNELQKSKKFDCVIVTVVSNTPDIKKIQDDIAAPLGLPLANESKRPGRLHNRLTNGEKILIILDDVWEKISFVDIGIPNKGNRNGCRILITSRDLRTCKSMQCDRIIELELLSEEDARMLFKNHAGLCDRSSKSIPDEWVEITKECKGLPIAIAVIASSLKGEQRQEEWDVALKSLQKPNPMHGDDDNLGRIYKCLRYSYDNMKNEKAKQLFLLCSVFREDEEIDVETLTRLSIAVGLVGEIDESYDKGRSQVAVIKNKLIDSCLLLKIDERKVKMHDLVREVALWIANEEVKAVNTSIKKEKSWVEKATNLKYLLCEGKGMDVFSLGFDKSNLEILIVHMDGDGNDSVQIPDSFFQNMIRLRVLYLLDKTTYGRRATLSLTQSLQSLTNIRYLYLKQLSLGDISMIRNLQGLETLDLESCSMYELPREIAELDKLKLLRLYWCEIRRNNPFTVIEGCSSLEELHLMHWFRDYGSTMHQKAKLPKVRRFQIMDRPNNYIEKEERNSLCVSKVDGLFSEATFKHLMQISDSIELSGLEGGWRNLMPDIILAEDEAALNLTHLRLDSISELECLIDAKHIDSRIQNVFSNLVVLSLDGMENLKEVCSGPLTLCNLTSMTLVDCPMLITLFPLSTIQSLVLLEYLVINNCEQLKSIITDENEKEDLQEEEIVDGNNDNKSGASLFPNLKFLLIERCPKLEFVLPGVAGKDVPKLEEISILDCVELKYIFGPYQRQQEEKDLHQELKDIIFAMLEIIVLEGLPNFVGIFWEYDQYTRSSVKRSCSKDDSKTEIESSVKRTCSKDGFKCNIFPWSRKYRHKSRSAKFPLDSDDQLQDSTLLPIIDGDIMNQRMSFLPRLKALVIKQCNNIKCVFPFSTSKMLPKLEVLAIIEASMLEEVFRWESDKVEISDVKVAIFVELPSFSQGIEFHTVNSNTVTDCWVQNCPKLSLNSTSTPEAFRQIIRYGIKALDTAYCSWTMKEILRKTLEDHQNPTTKATKDFPAKTKVQATSGNELISPQVNTSQSMHSKIVEDNQYVNGIESNDKQTKETLEIKQESDKKLPGLEIQSIATSPTNSELLGKACQSLSQLDIPLKESHSFEDQSTQEGSMSEKTPRTTFFTHPKMERISSRPLISPPQKENCEGQIAKPVFSIVNVEPATIKDVDDGDSQETSKSLITHFITNAPPENFSQITKDSSFISIVRRELEQLVSNKHLASENLTSLISFLVKNPSVQLTNNALSDRYKGFAYTCLVELLKFLQTHSVLDVLGSNYSEFVGLLQDVRRFGFDKNWLDGVERRALFPCLPSSENALKNLLDSKQTLIQHLEDLKHQLEDSIIQQETQVLEVRATLSIPLGY